VREKKLPPPTPSEIAFERLLAEFGNPSPRASSDLPPDARSFLDGLYANASAYLDRDPYASIGEATAFNTKVVGVSFEGRQDVVAALREGEPVELRRDAANPHDANAIGVFFGALQLGFLRRPIAARLAPNIDAGERYSAHVTAITGGGTRSFGINIYVVRERPAAPRPAPERGTVDREAVLRALIGERPLREAQRAVLARLDAGRNTLAVLGTGRGKSLCFQYPAAVRALERGEKTVVLCARSRTTSTTRSSAGSNRSGSGSIGRTARSMPASVPR
jgi:single-stranded-DNA-specific exonuclease